jgi:endonuclease/exonuclease/phosphatase family metal-dependent hydrolase
MAPTPEDNGTENDWQHRLPKVTHLIAHYAPTIVGLQEVSATQMKPLTQNLAMSTNLTGVGIYPTLPPVELGLGFLYDTKLLELTAAPKTIWLNEAQNRRDASAWDGSSYERFLIYARFNHTPTNIKFWCITTHFDHLGQQARSESAKIVTTLAAQLEGAVIVTGDFNCFPQLGGDALYQLLTTHQPSVVDSANLAKTTFGVAGSWIGWSYDQYRQKEGHAKYYHIFIKDVSTVHQHGIIDDMFWDNRLQKELYPSDHRPVISDLIL